MKKELFPIVDKYMKYGFATKDNEIVIPCIYEYAMPFKSGLAGVRNFDNHLMGFIDYNNNVIINFEYDRVHPFYDKDTWMQKDGLWGLISKQGDILIDHMYPKVSSFKNNVAIVQRCDGKWGLIDHDNNPVSEFKYNWLMSNDNLIFDVLIDGVWLKLPIDKIKTSKILKLKK